MEIFLGIVLAVVAVKVGPGPALMLLALMMVGRVVVTFAAVYLIEWWCAK